MGVSVAGVRSVDELVRVVGDGGQPKYLMFWGHQPSPGGGVGKGCFSQWWPSAFTVDGETYASAEHFMMAAKALLFGDAQTADRIRSAPHPKAAKALGRQVRGFDERRWAERRFDLVVTGNLAKFGQHPELGDFLIGTGGRVLAEASPVDLIWGTGLAADHQHSTSPAHWPGLNLLGFALMEVRHQLRAATQISLTGGKGDLLGAARSRTAARARFAGAAVPRCCPRPEADNNVEIPHNVETSHA